MHRLYRYKDFTIEVNAASTEFQMEGEFAALNRGARDSTWYVGWRAAIEPHFRRMSDYTDSWSATMPHI